MTLRFRLTAAAHLATIRRAAFTALRTISSVATRHETIIERLRAGTPENNFYGEIDAA